MRPIRILKTTSHDLMESNESGQAAYYRLGTSHALGYRRRATALNMLNVFLSAVLAVLGLLLLLSLIPRSLSANNSCLWPGPGSRCFWPFGRYHDRRHSVVLISMDGFRHDYLEIVRSRLGPTSLPNFARFESGGVRAMQSVNAFPTVTMPNHHTLVTGLYPEHHGVVANRIRDARWPFASFAMNNQTSLNKDPWLEGWPEPLWVTLQKSGGLAGSLLWPITDGFVQQDLPFQQVSQFTLLDSADSRYPYEKRVADVLWWLDNPRYHLDLVLAYFDEPDETGHAYGPHSLEVAEKVREMDAVLGYLLDGLRDHGLLDQVDVILTADHGMAAIATDRLIALDDFVDPSLYSYTQLSTVGLVYPQPGKADEVYAKLQNAHEHLKVYWLSEVPPELNFNRNSSRMPPVLLVPDPLWYLVHKRDTPVVAGDHGYTPNFSDMNPFLIASGPSFRKGHRTEKVYAVDIYPLLCGLFHLRPHANNGSLERIATVLLKKEVADHLIFLQRWPSWLVWLVLEMELLWFLLVTACALLVVVALGASIRMHRHYRRLMLHVEDEYDSKSVTI
ncbi:ectonucleotide pyrophosphatase/phosphodiesterase family member 5 [Paragonimus westermani]|uniref:Ectonucleotide pyrophosphatase/phosphodiesterase family member 5 n=1 Tax=Paragonimus westermani TaxID=34504 RepID=A0A5J4NL00_9TREM|nr:ectonucleotide pyrophosphatase/phosphodiesterase family member 5 [Paragonimus westermani]